MRCVSYESNPPGPTISSSLFGARQELVDELIGKLAADLIRHAIKDPRRGRRLA